MLIGQTGSLSARTFHHVISLIEGTWVTQHRPAQACPAHTDGTPFNPHPPTHPPHPHPPYLDPLHDPLSYPDVRVRKKGVRYIFPWLWMYDYAQVVTILKWAWTLNLPLSLSELLLFITHPPITPLQCSQPISPPSNIHLGIFLLPHLPLHGPQPPLTFQSSTSMRPPVVGR